MRCPRHLLNAALGACIAALLAVGISDDRPAKGMDAKTPALNLPVDDPPEALQAALADLTGADVVKRKGAVAALATREDAEPYVRHYSYTARGKPDAGVEELLSGYEGSRAKRNVKWAEKWAKEGRYDLLVDVCLHLPETDQLKEVGQAFFDFFARIDSLPPELRGTVATRLDYTMKTIDRKREVRLFHQKNDTLKTDWISWGLVRARSCEATALVRFNWLVLTREHLKGSNRPGDQWENCCIFHNSDLELCDLMTSLVVCDGDVNDVSHLCTHSLVIASGSIRRKNGIRGTSSVYAAGGDIVASGSLKHDNLFYAGGSIIDISTGKPRTGVEREKSGLKENPFGVRFFQTADVGVELAVEYGVVTVTKLTPGSPLTKYGVQVGDVITQVNDKPTLTLNDARRELRYSVALEAGILHIKRGQEKLTRVVYFKNGLEK